VNRIAALRMATNRPAALMALGFEARTTPCFKLENASGETAKLYVYDVIGGWDLDSTEFVQAVHAVTASSMDVHVNSPGGFVFDAVSMYEALQGHAATVNVHVDGLAASAASFLAMAGDSIDIAKGGRMMIHDAQGVGIGSPADLREYADLLDHVSDDISAYYADRAGGTAASWRTAMNATTWYSSAQAVDAGLADRVSGGATNEDARSQVIRARARITLKG
jgi:ATP-dependent protease ClpP protease subunit